MVMITLEQVNAANAALLTGQRDRILEYWSPELRWLVPGQNPLSGWKSNLEEFLNFMETMGRLSDNSLHMDSIAVMTADNLAANMWHTSARRVGEPPRVLEIDMIYFLRWRDGKIIEGQAAIFGDGTTQFDAFWS